MASRADPSIPNSITEELKEFVSFTLTCAAAGDYAAGDVLSASATADAGRATSVPIGGRGEIVKVTQIVAVCSEDSVTTRVRLHFFNYNPAVADVEMDDNAVFGVLTAAGAAGYVSSITCSAFVDKGVVAISETDLLDKMLACDTDEGFLYVVVETVDLEANETAAMTIRFDIYLS